MFGVPCVEVEQDQQHRHKIYCDALNIRSKDTNSLKNT